MIWNLNVAPKLTLVAILVLFALALAAPEANAKPAVLQPPGGVVAPPFLRNDAVGAVQQHTHIVRAARTGCRRLASVGSWSTARERRRDCEAAAIDKAISSSPDRSLAAYVATLTSRQRYSIGWHGHRLRIATAALGLASPPIDLLTSISDVRSSGLRPERRPQARFCEALATHRLLGDDSRMGEGCSYDELHQPTAFDGFARMRYHIAINGEGFD